MIKSNMKKFAVPILIIFILIGIIGFASLGKSEVGNLQQQSKLTISEPFQESVNYRASFAIFTNGLNRSFTAAMYHNLSDDTFITSDNPNIVLVKKPGITWGEFFDTLPFSLKKDCLTTGTGQTFCTNETAVLQFYLNGERENDLLSREIKDGDRALITYGEEKASVIQKQLEQVPKP